MRQIRATISFDNVQRFRRRECVRNPGFVIETDRVNDQCLSLPAADRVSLPGWIPILRVRTTVQENLTEVWIQLKQLHQQRRRLNDLVQHGGAGKYFAW